MTVPAGSRYRLICADGAVALREYAGQADLILTSPPYDGLRDYGRTGFDFDSMADSCVEALVPGGVLVWVVGDATVDGSETGNSYRQVIGFMDRGLNLHDTMIYEKALPRYIKDEPRYANACEYMFVFAKPGRNVTFNPICDRPNTYAGTVKKRDPQVRHPSGERVSNNSGYGQPLTIGSHGKRSNIWCYSTGNKHSAPDFQDAHQHPAIFPYALAIDHVRSWTNDGDLVVDPMCGSGTVVRAAVNMGRRAVGIDIHQPYVDLAEARMSQQALWL